MPNKSPLDMSKCDDGDADEVFQLEIIGHGNPDYAGLLDYEVDETLKKYNGHLRSLKLNDPTKLELKISALQREKIYRKRRKQEEETQKQIAPRAKAKPSIQDVSVNGDSLRSRTARASTFVGGSSNQFFPKSDCSGRRSKVPEADDSIFSEELEILNPSKGKVPFSHLFSNGESSTLDEEKDKCRIYSGDSAGPCPRPGLRSSAKLCNGCNKRVSPSHASSFRNSRDIDLFCMSCRMESKDRSVCTTKESPKGNSLSGTASGRKGNVLKRARQAVVGGESPEKVVELFSSEDEQEKDTRDTSADWKVSNQRNVYGTLSTFANSAEGIKIAYPSRDDPEAVEVIFHDLHRLEPLEFLNDTVIDFYIKYIQRPEALAADHKNKFYFFNSFFYKKLSEVVSAQNKKHEPDLSKLRKWTKGTNIFEKEYLFVPIHDKWHWSLAIVCHPGATSEDTGSQRCILHLDSMTPGHKSNTVYKLLRSYLLAEWKHQADEDGVGNAYPKLNGEEFAVKKAPVPQQENESDCGLFLLHYIQCFLNDAPSSFKVSDVDQGKLFGRNWFKPSEASDLRGKIQQLLETIFIAEAGKATENAAPIESLSGQHADVENVLPEETQPINDSDVEDVKVKEVTESVYTTVPCSGSGGSAPHRSNSSGLTGALKSAVDSASCADLGAKNKPRQVQAADDTEEMNMLQQSNSLSRDLEGEDECEVQLVVDIRVHNSDDVQLMESSEVACRVGADDGGKPRPVDSGHDDIENMDCCG